MADTQPKPVEEQLAQLKEARTHCLRDATFYPAIIQGILPIIGPSARVELRRWGADFLAETFANPLVSPDQRQTMVLTVLENLKTMIENPDEDAAVIKSVVQAAASIYPAVFKWTINNPYDKDSWARMTAIKSRILGIWDSALPGIRICCIKFAQRVVLTQTPAPPERRDLNDISVSMVPETHDLIPPQKLGAEASGLLDRILGVFHESADDAVLVDATLNSLSILIRARPTLSNKILNAILSFNPLKIANSSMTPKTRVMAKSMEKTTRVLLAHVLRRDPHGPYAAKIQAYVERNMRARAEFIDAEPTKKRGPPEPTDGLDPVKRQRLGAVAPPVAPAPEKPKLMVPPLAPGPHSVADLYTITEDKGLQGFDAGMIPQDTVVKIVVAILSKIDGELLKQAIAGILDRYNLILNPPPQIPQSAPKPPLNPLTSPLGVDIAGDDDEYDPELGPAEDTEQILNKLDNAPPEPSEDRADETVAISTFKMPAPQPLSERDAVESASVTIGRVVDDLGKMPDVPLIKKQHAGINRLAGGMGDKDAWITILTRLATRTTGGLENANPHLDPSVKSENGDGGAMGQGRSTLSDKIRERLYAYIFDAWRSRIDVAVQWLCEEWYSESVLTSSGLPSSRFSNYEKWALKILDGMMPYLDAKDKALTRFLGEIPLLTKEMLRRVKSLCRDPALVPMAITSLLYLVIMKPPSREVALDAVEEVWLEHEDARPMAGKYLAKWRPTFVEKQEQEQSKENQGSTSHK